MSESDVIAYIESVDEKNLPTIRRLLAEHYECIVKDKIKENKVQVLFKNLGKRPLPTLKGYKITASKHKTVKKVNKTNLEEIKLLFKNVCFDKNKWEELKEYIDLSVTIPTVATLLVLYTSFKIAELTF